MPRATEIIQAEETATPKSPLRRSCRIVAVSSPVPSETKPIKGRRLSSNLDKDDEAEQKVRGKRASSVTKENLETKTEPAKTRSRRLSNTSDSSVKGDENKLGARSKSSQSVEDAVQEPAKPIRRRRSSATNEEEPPKPVRTRRNSAQDDKEQLTPIRKTKGRTDPKQEETDPPPRNVRSRRSASRDLQEDNLETKRVTRSRRSSTDAPDEIPSTPIKAKQALSVIIDTVTLEDINEENNEGIESSTKLGVNKIETDKTNLDLSVIYETSFVEDEKTATPKSILNKNEKEKSDINEKDENEDLLIVQITDEGRQTPDNTVVRKSPRLQEKLQRCQFGEHSPQKKCPCMEGTNSETTSPKHKRSPQDPKNKERNLNKTNSLDDDVFAKEPVVLIKKTDINGESSKEECEANTSHTSESSSKENIDEPSKNIDLMKSAVVNRISNVFRPKDANFSFMEPMDVDTTINLNASKFDKSLIEKSRMSDANNSFSSNLSATYIEISEEDLVTEAPQANNENVDVEVVAEDKEETKENETETSNCEQDSKNKTSISVDEPDDDRFSETKDISDDYEFNILSDEEEKDPDKAKNDEETEVEGTEGRAEEEAKKTIDENGAKIDVNEAEIEESKDIKEGEGSIRNCSYVEEITICEEIEISFKQNETVKVDESVHEELKDDSKCEELKNIEEPNLDRKVDAEEPINVELEEIDIESVETESSSKQNIDESQIDTKSSEETEEQDKIDQSKQHKQIDIEDSNIVADKKEEMDIEDATLKNDQTANIDGEKGMETVEELRTHENVEESENALEKTENDAEIECADEGNVESKIDEETVVGGSKNESNIENTEEMNRSNVDMEVGAEDSNNDEIVTIEANCNDVVSTNRETEESNIDTSKDILVDSTNNVDVEILKTDENIENSLNEVIVVESSNSDVEEKENCEGIVSSTEHIHIEVSLNEDSLNKSNKDFDNEETVVKESKNEDRDQKNEQSAGYIQVEDISDGNEHNDMEDSFQDTIQDEDDDTAVKETTENKINQISPDNETNRIESENVENRKLSTSLKELEKKSVTESFEGKTKSDATENISKISPKKKTKRKKNEVKEEESNRKITLEEIIGREESENDQFSSKKSGSKGSTSKKNHRELEEIINSNSPSSFSLNKWFGNKSNEIVSTSITESSKIKKIKTKRIDPGVPLEKSEDKILPSLPGNTEKLDAFLDKKMAEFDTEEEETDDSENSDEEGNSFIDDMAEEGEEDTPSEDSNAIIDEGEAINTDSERSDDEDYENDSFICDEEAIELLSGDEYDLENSKTKKKSRIINVEDRNEEIIKIEKRSKPEPKKRKTRIIKMESSSESEQELVDLTKEVELNNENENESEPRLSTERGNRKSSITIIENINVKEIKDTALSSRINQLVDTFCTNIPQKGGVSMNLSLEYAGHSSPEQPEKSKKTKSQRNKRKSGNEEELKETVSLNENKIESQTDDVGSISLDNASSVSPDRSKKLKKKSKGKKRKSSSEEDLLSSKEPRLLSSTEEELEKKDSSSLLLENKEQVASGESKTSTKKKSRSEKRKRSNEEKLEEVTNEADDVEAKKKKRKKTGKSKRTEDETPSKSTPSTSSSYLDLESKTYGLMNQLITDVKNRSRRTVKPSTAQGAEENWQIELDVKVKPSTSTVTKKEKQAFKKFHPKDFRNQMLYNSSRVNRVETRKMLQKKGAYY